MHSAGISRRAANPGGGRTTADNTRELGDHHLGTPSRALIRIAPCAACEARSAGAPPVQQPAGEASCDAVAGESAEGDGGGAGEYVTVPWCDLDDVGASAAGLPDVVVARLVAADVLHGAAALNACTL